MENIQRLGAVNRIKTGLRPICSRRVRVYDIGASGIAATKAEAGDEITDDLFRTFSDVGLDRFAAALLARGLEFGDVSLDGTNVGAGISWLIYPVGNPDFVVG